MSKPSSDEDYLDNLLNSITHARTDSDNATSAIRKRQEAKAKARRSIDPNEDFMEATGIDGFTSKPVSHNNLRRALSEDDFLKQFEEELSESDSDDFLKQFDEKLELKRTDTGENFNLSDVFDEETPQDFDSEDDLEEGDFKEDELPLSSQDEIDPSVEEVGDDSKAFNTPLEDLSVDSRGRAGGESAG